MLGQLQDILTLFATGAGIYVAVGGLNAWKSEMTGKRDIELCQKVVELFYEAEHKMSVLRSPFSDSSESKSRIRGDNETESESERLDTLYVPLARYDSQWEFWSELNSYRFRMRASFGEKAVEPFDLINDALSSFRAAATTRYRVLVSTQN
jgi:hypothetical protein